MPTFTNTLLAHNLCERIAEKFGKTLIAPVIRPGCSEHNLTFSGTISVTLSVLNATIDAYIESLKHSGFRNFALVPTHGGNFEPMKRGYKKLVKKHRDVKIYGY